ncbi:disease resistance protein RGA2-like isoform X2 [Miscanthus floridulus]|uniref:disease resistance protein RGA2-like isoform X2 n=1 Tax=Miscanthus floridulus TaxID=154761 RepID=UPI0034584499
MDSGASDREVWEKKLEKTLQDPTAEPISLPLEFLKVITSDFSTERELGRGAYGVVYKGVLQSGKVIAVKKIFDAHLLDLDSNSNNNNKQFENEITCLMGVRHQNVVQLVGYCVQTRSEVMKLPSGEHVMVETPACLLCFEFQFLDWDMRYEIIRGVCRGLHYLHDECHIVHLDLKPQNILMDAAMTPKIADFGLSRLLNEQKSKTVAKKLLGTLGYMAKEYIDHGIISSKADIFSLGVIIIEIITGHRDYPNIGERTETSLKNYADEVVESWKNRLLEITPMHMSLEMHIQQVEQCISVALKCLEPDSKKRPTSLEIVQSLNAVELKCRSPGYPPSVIEKDRRNRNLFSQANANIINIPMTTSAINGLNECANLFQWVTLAISFPKAPLNETQKEKLHGDVRQLHGDLQFLSDTLPAMYNLIDRAEWRFHDHSVAGLLSRLKDAVYDAEDILDEFRWYETKLSVEGNAISVEPVIDFFHSVTQGSFNKVADIQKRLNHLSGQLEKMGLLQAVPRFDKSFRPETTSFPTEAKIFGRGKEKDKLIRLLGVPTNNSAGPSGHKRKRSGVCSSPGNQICATIDTNEAAVTSVPVLPIVGIGGVGKTTLAQDICKRKKVKRHFVPIIWICVSDDFDVKRLTKEAIEQSCGKVPKNNNLNVLQGALANSLNTKRFLLVVDDMWNENEQDWKRFCAPFRNALKGSMMLVTTRSPKVADVVRTMDPFPLEGLKKDVFRKFFKFCVFGPNSSNIDPELERIGEKILPKLRGSPLAAKTLGRLLGMSLELAHWDRILKSQLCELRQKETDILLALRLSYMYLPLYLKRCFSFCAVYPKDYIFKKEDLVEIWVAEGLVEHHPNISLHHTGGQYFEELAHLSFFQRYNPWSSENYVIHDLMHDMAQLVSKDECFIVKEKNDIPKIPQNVRHLSVVKGGDIQCSDLLKYDMAQHRKLRTLFCHLSLESETDNTVMEKWCNELLCMRVMVCSISKWGLPGSIGNMKLLRYLKILDSSLCMSLPSGFGCLYNMLIFNATKWSIDDIPSFFGMLINLQKFESAKYQFHHRYIHSVDVHEGASATDEGQRGQFQIENYNGESLPSWSHPQNSEQIHRYGNTNCTFLSLTDVVIQSCENLKSLEQFLQPAYVPIIKEIEISYCRSLESVPAERFGDLRFLEVLLVSHCPMIKSQRMFAPSLKKLYLTNSGNLGGNIECSSLTIFHFSENYLESVELQTWNFPLLQELNVTFCPSLTIIRDSEPISTGEARSRMGKFLKLAHLTIMNCDRLESIDDLLHLPAIERIFIMRSGLLSLPANRLGGFPLLKDLDISLCPRLDWQSGMLLPSSLQNLTLSSCGDFSAWFPSCLENLTSLESLQIIGCECIVSVPGHLWSSKLKSLQSLKFLSCWKLKSIGGSDAIAHIRDLCIHDCPELEEID